MVFGLHCFHVPNLNPNRHNANPVHKSLGNVLDTMCVYHRKILLTIGVLRTRTKTLEASRHVLAFSKCSRKSSPNPVPRPARGINRSLPICSGKVDHIHPRIVGKAISFNEGMLYPGTITPLRRKDQSKSLRYSLSLVGVCSAVQWQSDCLPSHQLP